MQHAASPRKGTLTISIDLEILWGIWDLALTPHDLEQAALDRAVCTRLLTLFRRWDSRATWATVARLLDDSEGFEGRVGDPAHWFAPDIVEQIAADKIDHEIGSHSYAHIYFRASSRDAVLEDMQKARRVHEAHGLAFDSFVFPRNQVAHLDVLKEVGIKVFRTTDAGLLDWTERRAPRLRPVVNLAEKALGLPSAVVKPRRRADGLVEFPSSTLLLARNGLRRAIHPRIFERKLIGALHRAVAKGAVFHLWFHPSNFYAETDVQMGILERCLEEAARLRDEGRLEIRTMGDFASAPAPAA